MRECKSCGFLLKFARYFVWRSDGTIVSTEMTRTKVRILFLEADEMDDIFRELSKAVDEPVDRILIEAERNVGKEFLADTPLRFSRYLPKSKYTRPQFLARLMTRVVSKDVAGLGSGVPRVDRYRGGESMTLRFSNPCFVPGTVGNALGIYEALEGIGSADYRYDIEEGGDLVIQFGHPERSFRSPTQSRIYLECETPGIGPLSYERCPKCGTPLAAAGALQWDIKRGITTNRFTGEREVIGSANSISAMMRKLEDELGDDVPGIIYNARKELSLRRLEDRSEEDPDKFWDHYLFNLAVRGLGYPDRFESDGGSVLVETRTAHNQVLYAARIAAALESLTGKPSEIRWDKREPHRGAYLITVATE